MDFSECIQFANDNPLTYIATIDGDRPRVRAFAMWFADATGFYYHTGTPKRIWGQLMKNPNVELCFYAPGEGAGTMMRVAGAAEVVDDAALKRRLLQERPWILEIGVSGPDDPKLGVFKVAHGEAYFWTMAWNMREAEAPRVRF
ncbi:MAG: pyridoxamine 5'-phosphate oxidase [Methanomicrobiales archaeon]|nr:pyridoxamine 5'-phosphate oxidase [Methanomicrobiales archaeon]